MSIELIVGIALPVLAGIAYFAGYYHGATYILTLFRKER